jgi:hypothetical protein
MFLYSVIPECVATKCYSSVTRAGVAVILYTLLFAYRDHNISGASA